VRNVFVKRSKQILQFNSFTSFSNYFNLVHMLESQIVDHIKSNCSWDMFLKGNSGGLHIFISFSHVFQLCTNARITKYGSREKYLFVGHVFVKRFRRNSQFHVFLRIISTLYPCQNNEIWIMWKVIVRETCFCEKILAYFIVSRGFQKYFYFVPMPESRNADHVKSNCSWDMFLWKNYGVLPSYMSSSKIF